MYFYANNNCIIQIFYYLMSYYNQLNKIHIKRYYNLLHDIVNNVFYYYIYKY